uniref:Agenet domain-containing protein n=1 Tax=Aegilops tauschii subsp. strangulata TaxID=200361 RepID=A0A453KSY7_AEGTS
EPGRLGIRLAKRPMLRPQLPSRYRKIDSPVDVGVIVDAWLNGGWWEGIVLQPETAGHVQVYLQGEGRLVEFKVDALHKSFEWREEQWMPLDARTDVAAKITLDLKKQKAAAAAAASPTGLLLQPREDPGTANSVPPRKRILELGHPSEEERLLQDRKGKGPADVPAKTVPDKASLQQRREEGDGDGMSRGGGSADAKQCRVDPANSDGLNCAERKGKAAKSSRVKKMGSSEGSGSQGGTSGSASSGGAAPVKPAVPMKEVCVTNGEAPLVAMDESEVIDLTMYD